MSRVGETGEEGETAGSPLTVGSGRLLTQLAERLRWRDRRDSNPKSNNAQSQSDKGISPFTKEQWTQIWTHTFLTRIVRCCRRSSKDGGVSAMS